MVELHRKGIVRRELWFDEPWETRGADLAVFYHWSKPVNAEAMREVHSLEIDLTAEQDAIWKNLTSTTRNLVNRGTKEGAVSEFREMPAREEVEEFLNFHRRFSVDRGMYRGEITWMYEYAAQGALMLSRSCNREGKVLAWHSYYRSPEWARLLHSVSLSVGADAEERKAIGWANRHLHWTDILRCREMGIQHYDFGGWYAGSTDEKLLGINAFKEQFGGQKTLRYHSMQTLSIKGKLFLKAREILKREVGLVHLV